MNRPLVAVLVALAAGPAAASAPRAPAPARAAAPGARGPEKDGSAASAAAGTKAVASAAAPAALAAKPADGGGAPQTVDTYAYLRLPLLSDRSASVPVAAVDDEVITVGDLDEALTATHEARAQDAHATGRDAAPVLERLVTLRLFVAEAREMGLDEQPAFQKAVAEFKEQQLRSMVELRATKGVRPERLEVEKHYKDAVREWKLRSLLLAKKEDADALHASLAAGKPFADLAKDAIAKKQATGNEGADWVGRSKMLPQVAAAVSRIDKAPAYTDVVAVQGGYAIASIEAVRYPDDPKAKAMAEEASIERQRAAKLEKYRADLEKKLARRDEKLFKALDLEAPRPGFAALAKDRRPLVTIRGAKPVTVADLAQELERYFFHGVEEPIKEKKLNDAKIPVLHKLLTRRLFLLAGERAGIPASAEYRKAVADFEASLLFGSYVQTVVAPDVKVTEDEGKTYYERHRAEFTFPAFYKLDGLAFAKQAPADAAAKKLAAGTDFGFLRANAEAQVKPDDRILALDGQTFSASTLPPDLLKALANAKRDDVREYATGGQWYVVRVVDVTPPKEQPYLEARSAIGKKLAAENLNAAVTSVAAKLRASHKVSIYLERIGN